MRVAFTTHGILSITELAESATGDEVIRDIAGHVSPAMLREYSHIRMKAQREALEGLVKRKSGNKKTDGD